MCNLAGTQKFIRRHSCSTTPNICSHALKMLCGKQSHKSGFWGLERVTARGKGIMERKSHHCVLASVTFSFLVAVELVGKEKTERGERDLSQADRCS